MLKKKLSYNFVLLLSIIFLLGGCSDYRKKISGYSADSYLMAQSVKPLQVPVGVDLKFSQRYRILDTVKGAREFNPEQVLPPDYRQG